jgi:hypothetical protein
MSATATTVTLAEAGAQGKHSQLDSRRRGNDCAAAVRGEIKPSETEDIDNTSFERFSMS